MRELVRILQATVSNDRGGLTGYICQNYRNINKEKVQFDFITYEDKLDFKQEFEAMGAKFYKVPSPMHFYSYYKFLRKIRLCRKYKAIHFNLSYANFVPVVAAKLAGYKRIIVHSHSTGFDTSSMVSHYIKECIHYLGRRLMPYLVTDYCACSKLAAKWMFPESIIKKSRYNVLYNAIDLSKFRYNEQIRKKLRNALGIDDDTFVVGHVGRFTYQKNHEFLVDIFREVVKKNLASVLLLIGDGPNRKKIKEKIEGYGLDKKVIFLGQRSDVSDLYQAMDVMVLPSRFEGLCIVAIEAQMAALASVCSEELSDETFVSSDIVAMSLSQSPRLWAEEVLKKKDLVRHDNTEILRKAGYDAVVEIRRVEHLYTNI